MKPKDNPDPMPVEPMHLDTSSLDDLDRLTAVQCAQMLAERMCIDTRNATVMSALATACGNGIAYGRYHMPPQRRKKLLAYYAPLIKELFHPDDPDDDAPAAPTFPKTPFKA